MSSAPGEGDAPSGPIAWMARNHIAANLAMMLLFVAGAWSASAIQKEVEPDFILDFVDVSVVYPGAAPSEVEKGILLPIEEAVRGIQGIKEITSSAREGSGSVEVELVAGADRMRVFQDVDQAVTRIPTFPEDIEEPEVRLRTRQRQVVRLALYGDVDIWGLRQLAERLRDRLLNHPEITQIEIGRAPAYVTHVEVPLHRLREFGLTLGEVAEAIRTSSQDVAAGVLETDAGEILLRLSERKQYAEELRGIPIVTTPSGAAVTLGELANVTDGFEETGYHSRFNQQHAVQIEVYRVGKQSPLDISEAVDEIVADFALPEGVSIFKGQSSAEDYRERLSLLVENGLLAIVIVLGILALFLELRLAFWVMVGMAVSFIGAFVFLPLVGVSINMISMFGFLVVLGVVVDDAIVVGENVYEHRERGADPLRAAIEGTREIAGPVIVAILTSVVTFVPLLAMPGQTGKYWWPMPAVVVTVLLVSLAEALFILPAHLAHLKNPPQPKRGWFALKQRAFADRFNAWVRDHYAPLLNRCLRYRYVTLTAAVALLLVIAGFGYSGHMGMVLMPEVAAHEIEAGVRLPVGATPEQAAEIADRVTAATRRMFDEHGLQAVADGIKTNVRGGSFVDVEIVMKPPDQREMTANQVIKLWRDEIGDIPGVSQISFEAERGPGGHRQDISLDLSHSDIEVLAQVTARAVASIEQLEETRDVNDNYDKGKAQFNVRVRSEGQALGLTPNEIGQQLRDAFYGALAMRQLRGTNEVEVRVKLPEAERQDIRYFDDFIVRLPGGGEVPLKEVAQVERTEAFKSITRRDGRRVVNVSTDVEPKSAVSRVLERLERIELPALREDYPDLTWSFRGGQAEMRESTQSLWLGFGLAIAVIFGLLAVSFRNYVHPLVVMGAIPFGIVGAIIGHLLLGYDLSLVSVMGLVALSGVVVNDALIMVDYANRKAKDTSRFEAILQAGVRRFRPIILTTLTTFAGLTPIILERSQQARHLIPMAISLGFGIIFATAIILIVVPCLYLVAEDAREKLRTLREI